METLRCKFVRVGNTILMKVLEQPECIKRGSGHIFSYGGIFLTSHDYSRITEHEISVHGTMTEHDLDATIRNFSSESTAEEILAKYVTCVREYNKMLKAPKLELDSKVTCIIAE